jgi:membrane-associated PAP2 superfamily phosphatase
MHAKRGAGVGRQGAMAAAFVAAALVIIYIGNATDLDLRMADALFDRASNTFPWRHAWLTEVFAHVALKRTLVVLGLGFVLAALWDLVARRSWGALRRSQVRVVALSAILVPGAISLLKHLSASHCPWDLQRYGGIQPYVRLLEALPQGVPLGHCMPAGHASTALWMMSLAVFFLPSRPRAASAVVMLTLAGGFAIGWMQQMRGAHFLTHTLWSIWIAGAIIVLLQQIMAPRVAPLPPD